MPKSKPSIAEHLDARLFTATDIKSRAKAASKKASELQPSQPEVLVAQAWVFYSLTELTAA